jgi:hypothetical protein
MSEVHVQCRCGVWATGDLGFAIDVSIDNVHVHVHVHVCLCWCENVGSLCFW